MKNKPYIIKKRIVIDKLYNPEYGDDKVCECGHEYYRHFDSYDDNKAVGCKYCPCYEFKPKLKPTINYIVKTSGFNGNKIFECESENEVWEAIGTDWSYEVSSPTNKDISKFIPF